MIGKTGIMRKFKEFCEENNLSLNTARLYIDRYEFKNAFVFKKIKQNNIRYIKKSYELKVKKLLEYYCKYKLSNTQQEIIKCLKNLMTTYEIAVHLKISESAVKKRIQSIKKKYGITQDTLVRQRIIKFYDEVNSIFNKKRGNVIND